jgi:hypothetical protein
VERVRDDEPEDERAEADEDPLPKLFEVLDERDFLAVFKAAWKALHVGG